MLKWILFSCSLFVLACGKHESTSYGFTNNSNTKQGTQASTQVEILKTAIEKGNKDLFLSSLESVGDVNIRLSGDRTPLIQSVISEKPIFVFILLQKGADATLLDDKQKNAIDYANEKKNDRILLMLDSNKFLEVQEDLFAAVTKGAAGAVLKALQSGANPNSLNNEGESPLTLAIKQAQLKKKSSFILSAINIAGWKDDVYQASMTDVNFANALGEKPLPLAESIELTEGKDIKNKDKLLKVLREAGATE